MAIKDLFPAKKDGRTGYVDRYGKVIIDFEFDFFGCKEFTEGLAAVVYNGKSGFIDCAGNFLIEPKFEFAYPFSSGLAAVRLNHSWGFIDKSGEIVIEAKFHRVEPFRAEFAFVFDNERSNGNIINTKGEVVCAGYNFLNSKLEEGLVNCTNEHNLFGYVDPMGVVRIDFGLKYAWPFYEGKAAFIANTPKSKNSELVGFLSKNGDVVIEPQFQGSAFKFSEGLCLVWNKAFGYINSSGDIEIPHEFDTAKDFCSGLAAVKPLGRNKGYGFINKSGELIIPAKYKNVSSFSNGIAEVIVGSDYSQFKYGLINLNGEEIWEPRR